MTPIRLALLPLSPIPGGAERQMATLAERLPRDRFDVELIVDTQASPLVARALDAGIRVHNIGFESATGHPAGRSTLVDRGRTLLRLAATARSGRYDIIDAWLYPMDVLMAVARPLIHSPVIVSGRRNIEERARFGPLEPLVRAIALRRTDAVVANSQAVAGHAVTRQGVDPAAIRVIRNGVEIPPVVGPVERLRLRQELGAAPDDVLIGSVAGLRRVKRLDLLIAALARIAPTGPRVRLAIFGDGPLRGALEAQVSDLGLTRSVTFRGFDVAPEAWYQALDIVALSSDREGLPNALLEGGAAGCALISTAAGGAVEIINDGTTGLLVPVGDADGLAAALARLAADPDLRSRLGAAARRHIEEQFGMDRFVAEFATLYEGLVSRRIRETGRP